MILRGLLYFFVLAITCSLLKYFFELPFGTVNYFENHGFLFLFFLATFPRATLLFSSVASGGIIWWFGWLVVPRILVATLATFAYFQTNPVLVTISWLVAIGGESYEKRYVQVKRVRPQKPGGPTPPGPNKEEAIEAEFKRL
jgi:hypothetical protein